MPYDENPGSIIPFDFEDQAVRVVKIDGEPWFVAADLCRVLEIANSRDAVARLDDDERADVGITDASGLQTRKTNIISESGLYALVFTSRKPEARRFRKWVTSVVLPAIRKTGRYEMPGHTPAGIRDPLQMVNEMALRDREFWLSTVRETRQLLGPKVAARMWAQSPLPPLPVSNDDGFVDDEPTDLQAFLQERCQVTGSARDFVSSRDLLDAFRDWALELGAPPTGERAASLALRRLVGRYRDPETGFAFAPAKQRVTGYRGIRLKASDA